MSFLLDSNDVLGANARIAEFQRPLNSSKSVSFAKDKLKTKDLLRKNGIKVARTFDFISSMDELRYFDMDRLPDNLAIKPNHGAFGEGIMICHRDEQGSIIDNKSNFLEKEIIINHFMDIIYGKYSNRNRDQVLIEEVLNTASYIDEIMEHKGLADIRVIVCNMVPVMAMIRLPTVKSKGIANLAKGGMGVGIDITTGKLTYACVHSFFGEKIVKAPHLKNFQIKDWDNILLTAIKSQQVLNAGYSGVDIAVTEDGPVVLELNSRPGLVIQIANKQPLRQRLRKVLDLNIFSPEHGLRVSKELFYNKKANNNLDHIKPIIPKEVDVYFDLQTSVNQKIKELKTIAKIDLFYSGVSIPKKILDRLNLTTSDFKNNTIKILDRVFENVDINLDYDSDIVKIGGDITSDFLIDSNLKIEENNKTSEIIITKNETNFKKVDKMFFMFYRSMPFLRYMRIENIEQEKKRFFDKLSKNKVYNPIFKYKEINPEIFTLIEKIKNIRLDDSPMGIIFAKKREEFINRVELMKARNDNEKFIEHSRSLNEIPTDLEIKKAFDLINNTKDLDIEKNIDAEEAIRYFEAYINKYKLNWRVSISKDIISSCVVSNNNTVLISNNAKFSENSIKGTIEHEIGVHVMTRENGNRQPWLVFSYGFSNYLETQEGLAAYMQHKVDPHSNKIKEWAVRFVASKYADSHSFYDSFIYLHKELGLGKNNAFQLVSRIKRGMVDTSKHGAFLKDVAYLRGYLKINDYIKNKDNNMSILWIGKINIDDMNLIHQLKDLKKPFFTPDSIKY